MSNIGSLISTFGREMTYHVITEGAFNTTTGVTAADTEVDYDVRGITRSIKVGQSDGVVVMYGDIRVLFDRTNFEKRGITPKLDDAVTIDGVKRKVVTPLRSMQALDEKAYDLLTRGLV